MFVVGDYVAIKDSDAAGLTGYVYDVSPSDPHLLYVQLDGRPGKFMHSPGWIIMDEYVELSSSDMYGEDELLFFSQLALKIREGYDV